MRIFRTILVWTTAAAAAGGWWFLRGAASVTFADHSAIAVIAGPKAIDPERITSLRLERGADRGAGRAFVLKRQGETWTQVEPFPAELDGYSARQLVSQAASLVAVREIPDADSPESAAPAAVLTLEGDGVQHRIEFLRRGVAGRAWLRANGKRYVTESSLYERAVEMDPKEWRSRSLFPESLGRIERIRRISREGTIQLERAGERWSMVSPIRTRADRARVEELVAAIGKSRSDGFIFDQPTNLEPFGLAAPIRTLAVDYAASAGGTTTTRTLLIGAPLGVGSDDCYAMIEGIPTVVRLSGQTRDVLLPPDALLVDPTATSARPADVKRIEIRTKDASLELVRSLDQWTVAPIDGGVAGAALAAQTPVVEALLSALCVARAPEMSFAGFPKDLEVATVLLFGFDGKPLDIVRVARDTKSSRWGFDNGEGALRVHPAAMDVPLGLAAFTGG